jgi:protein MpaA
MLTRRNVIAGILLLVLALCWVLPRAADAVVGNTRIVFYGKVVNAQGVPVEGAEVKAKLLANDRLLVGGAIREFIFATSDGGGRFTLKSNRGTSLEIQTIRRSENPDPMSMWYPSEKERGFFIQFLLAGSRTHSVLRSGEGPSRGVPHAGTAAAAPRSEAAVGGGPKMKSLGSVGRLVLTLGVAALTPVGCSRQAPASAPAVGGGLVPRPPELRNQEPRTVMLGTSVKGSPIAMEIFGDGPDVTLIFSAIHGDEPAAAFVARKLSEELRKTAYPASGNTVALIAMVNPDGVAAGTRTNANGVDCNRNFPASNWKRTLWGRSNPGARAASEPETLAVMKAIEMVKPARIVSIHSGLHCNNYDGPAEALAALLARHNGYPVRGAVGYPTPGSFGSWAGSDLGLPVVTLELPRSNNGERAWAENRDGLLALMASGGTVTERSATAVQD